MNISRAWNAFLDTPPRRWPSAVAGAVRSVARPSLGAFVAVSLAAHAILLVYVNGIAVASPRIGMGVALPPGTFELVSLPAPPRNVNAGFDQNSTILSKRKVKRDRKRTLDQDLARLLAQGFEGDARGMRRVNAVDRSDSSKRTPTIARFAIPRRPDDRENKGGFSAEKLGQELARHQAAFQRCYETALLRDAALNGRVEVVLAIGDGGAVDKSDVRFSGEGRAQTRDDLRDCIKTALAKVRLPESLASAFGKSISFEASLSL